MLTGIVTFLGKLFGSTVIAGVLTFLGLGYLANSAVNAFSQGLIIIAYLLGGGVLFYFVMKGISELVKSSRDKNKQ